MASEESQNSEQQKGAKDLQGVTHLSIIYCWKEWECSLCPFPSCVSLAHNCFKQASNPPQTLIMGKT